MSLPFSLPLLIQAATWTTLLTVVVAVASFSAVIAFVWAVESPECTREGMVRVPLDIPGEVFCLPSNLLSKSNIDFVVPPIFAAVVVAGAAWLIRSITLSEDDHHDSR